jgi:hypothetical protein
MLKKYENQIVLAIFAFWILGFAFQTGRSTQHQEDRKQIEAPYKSGQTVQNQHGPDDSRSRPDSPTKPQTGNRNGEAPEVTFIGLKLGEGLLVFVTVWLVLVTKALVDGSKETAERQLRAYVHIVGKEFLVQGVDGERFVNQFSVLNAGQTPAYKLRIDTVTKVLVHPLPENCDFAFHARGPQSQYDDGWTRAKRRA